MEYKLNQVSSKTDLTLYELTPSTNIETFIASSTKTIQLLNKPEICGIQFQNMLSDVLIEITQCLYDNSNQTGNMMKSLSVDVFYVLRGGLNFDLHKSIPEVTQIPTEVSFLSSQRVEASTGFDIGESNYQKWSIQDNSLVCVGDIIATSTTLMHILERAITQYELENKQPKWLLIFTIGTSNALKILELYIEKLKKLWSPNFQGASLVYVEQIFDLYTGKFAIDEKSDISKFLSTIHLPYTDFFRKNLPVAFEFEHACISNPVCYLERCAIYDGGSRAFEPKTYLGNLYKYWSSLLESSSICDIETLIRLKSSFDDYQYSFEDWLQKRCLPSNYGEDALKHLHTKGQNIYHSMVSRSLDDICQERLQLISREIANLH